MEGETDADVRVDVDGGTPLDFRLGVRVCGSSPSESNAANALESWNTGAEAATAEEEVEVEVEEVEEEVEEEERDAEGWRRLEASATERAAAAASLSENTTGRVFRFPIVGR